VTVVQSLLFLISLQGSSAVENGPVNDGEPPADGEDETEAKVESTTREPSLPPSTAG